MSTLIILSTPGGSLTYEDGDIVDILPADKHPGESVAANPTGAFSFLYVTDKESTDPEIVALREPLTEGEEQTKKRAHAANLPGWQSGAYSTYLPLADATAQQVMAWQVFQAKVQHKGNG